MKTRNLCFVLLLLLASCTNEKEKEMKAIEICQKKEVFSIRFQDEFRGETPTWKQFVIPLGETLPWGGDKANWNWKARNAVEKNFYLVTYYNPRDTMQSFSWLVHIKKDYVKFINGNKGLSNRFGVTYYPDLKDLDTLIF